MHIKFEFAIFLFQNRLSVKISLILYPILRKNRVLCDTVKELIKMLCGFQLKNYGLNDSDEILNIADIKVIFKKGKNLRSC